MIFLFTSHLFHYQIIFNLLVGRLTQPFDSLWEKRKSCYEFFLCSSIEFTCCSGSVKLEWWKWNLLIYEISIFASCDDQKITWIIIMIGLLIQQQFNLIYKSTKGRKFLLFLCCNSLIFLQSTYLTLITSFSVSDFSSWRLFILHAM